MIYRILGFAAVAALASPVVAATSAAVSDQVRYDAGPDSYPASISLRSAEFGATPVGVAIVNSDIANAFSATPLAGMVPFTGMTSVTASAAAGELHVAASYADAGSPLPVNSYLIASASWSDSFTLIGGGASGGTVYAEVKLSGTTPVSNSGVSIAYVDFDFFDGDPDATPNLAPIASYFARQSTYGGFATFHQDNFDYLDGIHFPFASKQAGVHFAYTASQPIYVRAYASCTLSTLTVAAGAAVDDRCDLSHSVYWGGITAIKDSNGDPVVGASVTSGSGFDYALASPNAPAAVPEPAAWALLLTGFGLSGAALRRRRPIAA